MRTIDRSVISEYIETAAMAVAAAARSAPHTTGDLELVINILTPEEIKAVQQAVVIPGLGDPEKVLVYDGMLTIGAVVTRSDTGWDCGACGFETCGDLNRAAKPRDPSASRPPGPCCNWKILDWSISLDYAAAMASQLGLQTRVQDIQGAAALALGYAGAVDVCSTVPLMAEKRNPLFAGRFDGAPQELKKARLEHAQASLKRLFPTTMDLDMFDVLVSSFGLRLSPNLAGMIEPGPPAPAPPRSKGE
ncbi:MAG: hypothetical protein KKB20_27095 [Proteobacteria bacterium]|nr:hypothetical protein [Pseudomonadota bacterium]